MYIALVYVRSAVDIRNVGTAEFRVPLLLSGSSFTTSVNGVMKSREIRWEWHVANTVEKSKTCWALVGKLEGKRPLGTR